MNSPGSVLVTVGIAAGLLAIAAGIVFFFYQRSRGGVQSLFATRPRRVTFVERTSLDGGRKLLLVRRDDVEHLILVGGPIDLVVETGIRVENSPPREETSPVEALQNAWSKRSEPSLADLKIKPLFPARNVEPEDETLELTPLHEAKAAE
jgi:hypothetical protein